MRAGIEAFRKFGLLRVYFPEIPGIVRAMRERVKVVRPIQERERGKIFTYLQEEPCYHELTDGEGELYFVMGYGFYVELQALADQFGCPLTIYDTCPADLETAARLLPDMRFVQQLKLRENQRPIVDDIIRYDVGQYVACTGMGKSFVIEAVPKIFPWARILVTTYSRKVLTQLHEQAWRHNGIDAGIVHSAKKDLKGRVIFCSLGCLDHVRDREWDILLLDEKHECTTLKRMALLARIKYRRAYAFSANHEYKEDSPDYWLTAVFGLPRIKVDYQAALEQKDIVPLKVTWIRVPSHRGYRNTSKPGTPYFERKAYWINRYRNDLIAEVALDRSAKHQTLVYVSKVEHIYELKKRLDCPVVHAPHSDKEWAEKQEAGIVPRDAPNPSVQEMEEIQRRYAAGEIPLVICNSVWKRGLNFPYIQTIIRADASKSIEDATQITGRGNRKFPGKEMCEIVDFWDEYDDSCLNGSRKRKSIYKEIGYEQFAVTCARDRTLF